jgi:hypothetical protein
MGSPQLFLLPRSRAMHAKADLGFFSAAYYSGLNIIPNHLAK